LIEWNIPYRSVGVKGLIRYSISNNGGKSLNMYIKYNCGTITL